MRESVHFSTACTTTGLCSPSRAAMLTGRLGHRTGLDDNCHVWHSRLMGLDHNQTTLLEWAREKDYLVGYFGKWHLGPDGPIRRGVHRFTREGFERGRTLPDKPDFERIKRYYDKDREFNEKPEYYATRKGSYADTPTKQKADDAIAFLNDAKGSELPFFLTASFNAPHPPYVAPKPYGTLYDHSKIKLPASLNESIERKPKYQRDPLWYWHDLGHMNEKDWRKSTSHYWGLVSMIDKAVGEIVVSGTTPWWSLSAIRAV
jgi:arylsulfatase A-like enzyme